MGGRRPGVVSLNARGHLACPRGLRRRNGGEISGPRSPQPPVPPLSSTEIELPRGSTSAGGAAVITTTTRTRNANAIITDTIRHGGRYNKNLCSAGKKCTHNLRTIWVNYPEYVFILSQSPREPEIAASKQNLFSECKNKVQNEKISLSHPGCSVSGTGRTYYKIRSKFDRYEYIQYSQYRRYSVLAQV